MKDSMERIVKWAKAHPYLAGAILIGVVVLAWLTIKRGGFGGGGQSVTQTDQPDTTDSGIPPLSSPDLSALGGDTSASIPVPGNGGGGTDSAGNTTDFDQAPTYNDIPTGSYAYATGSPVSSLSMSSGSLASFGSDAAGLGKASAGTAQGKSAAGLGRASAGVATEKKASGIAQAIAARPELATASRNPAASLGKASAGTGSGLTPAEKIGKGRNFTGIVNGVRYYMGYLVPPTSNYSGLYQGVNYINGKPAILFGSASGGSSSGKASTRAI